MALSALTVATAERAEEAKEKNEWVRDAGDDLPSSVLYPTTRCGAKEQAYHLEHRAFRLAFCEAIPPEMRERAKIASNLLSSIWSRLEIEDEEAAK